MESAALTTTEHDDLARLETKIAKGLAYFMDVGQALAIVRDRRLYRAKHETFEDYCQEKWHLPRRRAYQIMEAAGGVEGLDTESVCKKLHTPIKERQALALASVPKEDRQAVFDEAVETAPKNGNGKPKFTAKHVQKVVAKRKEPTTDTTPSVKDEIGRVIPTPDIRAVFELRKDFRAIYATFVQAKKDLLAIMNTPAGVYLDEQEIETRMKDARNLVTTYTMPHAVCPFCGGNNPKTCKACKQSGWMPEKVYKQLKSAAEAEGKL